jgi:hypothetical protein
MEAARRHGWRRAAAQYWHKGLTRAGVAQFLHVLCADGRSLMAPSSASVEGHAVRQLAPAELQQYAEDKRMDMEPDFIERALHAGSVCLGVFVGETLAGYAWYGRQNMELMPGLTISVRGDAVYVYKVYTVAEYRGRNCMADNLRYAMAKPVLPRATRLVCLVECSNPVSFLAFRRVGFRPAGRVCIIGRPSWRRCVPMGEARRNGELSIRASEAARG